MTPTSIILIFIAGAAFAAILKNEKHIRITAILFAFLGGVSILSLSLPTLLNIQEKWANNLWFVDNFSALIVSLIAFVYISATIVSSRYIGHEYEEKIITLADLRMYFVLLQIFVLCMVVTVLANNTLLMWIALEGTTLSSTFLVGLYRRKTSIEAAWKYIIICSTGISLGLIGILMMGYGASLAGVKGNDIFLLSSLGQNSHLIAADIVRWSFIFLFVGFGAKVGFAPMHTWLPDAHSKAPSPISALFSGILLNVALYAILRFKFISDGALGSSVWSNRIFLIFALISILIPAFIMLVQNNYKRMLAYSSVEHMGLIAFAISLSPIGVVASVVHMIGHTLTKSFLFFGAGEILIKYKTTKTEKIKGLLKKSPYTAMLFLIGILAIIAMPPSMLFVSEYAMFSNAIVIHPVISLFVFAALSVIAYAMLKSTILMFTGDSQAQAREKWNITHSIMVLQLVLIVLFSIWFSTDSGIDFINSIARDFTHNV